MPRLWTVAAALLLLLPSLLVASQIEGDYLESRTCDVYTGPCFANAQVGLTGREAILAWNIKQGSHDGVDLKGLKVVMAVSAQDTLGFGGGLSINPDPIRSVMLVDESATPEQRVALANFAKERAQRAAGKVVRIIPTAIDMDLDHAEGVGKLKAGKIANLETRKVKTCDCVCTNEKCFYPPLTDVKSSRPAVTVDGGYSGPGLGSHWSNPRTRSAFLGKFE